MPRWPVWFVSLTMWTVIVLGMSQACGCYNRYTVRGDSPSGIPSVTYESTPFTSTTDVDVSPALSAQERCLARAPRDGGAWVWLMAENLCFFQSTSGSRGGYAGGTGAFGAVGYSSPRLGAPGVR